MLKIFTLLLIFILLSASTLGYNLNKERVHFCDFMKDCNNLTPKARGCISFSGTAGQCFWMKEKDVEKRKYRFTFDD